MATSERSRPENVPQDLLPILRRSGVLSEAKCEEVRARVLQGDLPTDSIDLARKLVKQGLLTEYQARRLLSNRAHGLTLGRYVILDRLGSGSMGRVYKARHQMMDREVALKVIAPEIGSNERVVARFQREMRLVGKLDHPNVVRAFDADKDRGILYIAMEYVRGESLGAHLRSKGPIPSTELVDYAVQAALGLHHAHEQGIVHRDIKPSNLLLGDDRRVKVLDLGLGVLMEADEQATFATADGIAVGTIDYMSPEQACGRDVDGRSDLYSLGCAMYHLLTGKLPFPGSSPVERLGVRINGRHVPITDIRPDIPAGLVRVLDTLMANRPDDRYQSATEAAEALQGSLHRKSKSTSNSRKASKERTGESALANAETLATASTKIEIKYIEVRPAYPAWFQPMADLAERSPLIALVAVLLIMSVFFASGLLVHYLVSIS